METKSDQSEQIAAGLRKLLNSHGHSFQYAVVRRADTLHSERRSQWVIDGVEFPVLTGGQTAHVDFILRSRSGQTYIVGECKRADPAKANWCFARAPYTRRNERPKELTFEQFSCNELGLVTRSAVASLSEEGVYHLGFELKTGETGDGVGQRSQAINEAVAQVLRGISGLVNHLQSTAPPRPEKTLLIRFIPVVVTTAHLYVTDADIAESDLRTGNLQPDSVKVKKTDVVWFTHNRSPAMQPDAASATAFSNFNEFSAALRNEFARSVAIISPDGIDEFLSRDLEESLW
jgi:hypothetical protein